MNNFLLSGDPRDEEKVNKGLTDITDQIKRANRSLQEAVRTALIQVESTEASWADNLPTPDRQAPSGRFWRCYRFRPSDLYLQKDPSSWLTKSSVVLDQSNADITKFLEETTRSAGRTSTFSTWVTTGGTFLALLFGGFIAVYTAKSITEPLSHLITVAREIGDSGDLDQNIEYSPQRRNRCSGHYLQHMVAYLKEMASVSMSVAEGDLTVEVVPRSKRDTLAMPSFACPHGLQELVRTTRDSPDRSRLVQNQVAGAADESAKVSVQASSAIEEVTSTMHEMSVNVQNVVKNTQVQASSVAKLPLPSIRWSLHSARGRYRQGLARYRQPLARGSRHRYSDHGEGHRRSQPHQPGHPVVRGNHQHPRSPRR